MTAPKVKTVIEEIAKPAAVISEAGAGAEATIDIATGVVSLSSSSRAMLL